MTFKEYYDEYYKDKTVDAEVSALKEELEQWKKYRNLIIKDKLSEDEFNTAMDYFKKDSYQNREGSNKLTYSLRELVENKSDSSGSMGMMVSSNFPLRLSKDEKDKSNWNWFGSGKELIEETADAKERFKKIRNFLNALVTKKTLDDVYKLLEKKGNEKFEPATSFPQGFLVKLIVLNSLLESSDFPDCDYQYKLFGIYKFANIEKIKEFEELSNCTGKVEAVRALKKSKRAVELFNSMFTDKTEETNQIKDDKSFLKAQYCLWDFANPDSATIKNELNVIFYGAPGTGKTYAVKKALHSVPEDQKLFVQFHPGFSYEDFIEGIKPTGIDEKGNLKFEIVNGVFKNFCIKARDHTDKEYYFVADEINRANLSAVFGEVLSLLERDYRYDPDDSSKGKTNLRSTPLSKAIERLQDEKKKELAFNIDDKGEVLFGVPKNVHFIGMMNDVDKSIDTFDLALRRRFVWIRKDFDGDALKEILEEKDKLSGNENQINEYITACKNLNAYISGCTPNKGSVPKEPLNLGKSFEFGHAFYKDVEVSSKGIITQAAKAKLFDNHLAPTLREYCRSFFNETEIDKKIGDAKKVFAPEN